MNFGHVRSKVIYDGEFSDLEAGRPNLLIVGTIELRSRT